MHVLELPQYAGRARPLLRRRPGVRAAARFKNPMAVARQPRTAVRALRTDERPLGQHQRGARGERPAGRTAGRRRAPDTRLRAASASTRSTAPAPPPTRPAPSASPAATPSRNKPARSARLRAPTRPAARRSTRRARGRGAASSGRPAGHRSSGVPAARPGRGAPDRGARARRRSPVPASAARAPPRTAAGRPSRSWRPRASCRGLRSGRRRCGPPRRSDRSAKDQRVAGIGPHRLPGRADGHPPLARNLLIISSLHRTTDDSDLRGSPRTVRRRLAVMQVRTKILPRPRNDRKPKTSVNVVMKTDDASAGSTLSARRPSGISVPADGRDEHVDDHGGHQDEPERPVPAVRIHTPIAPTSPLASAVAQPDQPFFEQRLTGVAPGQLAERDAADDDRQRLRRRVAAHAGHDRHEGRQRDHLVDGPREQPDDRRRDERGRRG